MLRAIVAFPFLLILVIFALSNRAPVDLHFWPTDFELTVPLSVAILVGAGACFFLGALFTWFGALGQRYRAKRAERRVQALESEVLALQAKLQGPAATRAAPALPSTPALASPEVIEPARRIA
ncbi:MAG TPA: LapA family protein [Acetobacteraceae bacterium]|nr:LapA family protein [Acetobacteraceae bacterium]